MNAAKPRNVWLWWAYFVFGVIVTGWGAFFIPDPLSAMNIVSDIAAVITLIAIFGYVTQQPFGSGKAWLVLAPIIIAAQVAFFIYALVAPVDAAPLGAASLLVGATLGTALLAPSIWALYAYAFRSSHVWQGVHA